jgi:hypothetical protein
MRFVVVALVVLVIAGLIRPSHIACAQAPVASGTVITIAGNGSTGFAGDGGPATSANLAGPLGLAIGPEGKLYISDVGNNRIRAVHPTSGIISTLVASTENASHIAVDRQLNTLYFPLTYSEFRVNRVNLSNGTTDNFAGIGPFDTLGDDWNDGDGGPATSAYLLSPFGIGVGAGNDVLITDGFGNHRLRSVDGATGVISRVAGIEPAGNPVNSTAGDGGPASQASFTNAWEMATDRSGNIFVIDLQDSQPSAYVVRRIDAATGMIDTVAGGGAMTTDSGLATDMLLTSIDYAIAVDEAGETMYLVRGAHQVVAVDLATGQLTPFAGSTTPGYAGDGGPATGALFDTIGGLAVVPGGGLLVADTNNERVRYIAPDSINLVGDAAQTEFHLPWVSEISGDLNITDNPNLTALDFRELTSVFGNIAISNNSNLSNVDLGSLQSVEDDVNISNMSTGSLDLTSLESVGGNLILADNASDVNYWHPGINVGGSLTLESTGGGTLELDDIDVGGDTSVTADGYATVDAATADGSTAVTMINNEATMEVTLPDGAFTSETPVAFRITNQPAIVETIDGNTVTHLATYAFEFSIPTLNSDAELNFEIELAAMAEPDRLLLLDALDDEATLTLGVIGDAPGAELQLFDVCASGGPVVDACVVVQWLDENRTLLDPQGVIDPSFLRLEGLVGHFSTYSFVAITLDGDYNHDGIVDAADYVVWRKTDGTQAGYDQWRANFGAVSLALVAGSGSSFNMTVPEPATLVLLMLAAVVRCLQRGRTA